MIKFSFFASRLACDSRKPVGSVLETADPQNVSDYAEFRMTGIIFLLPAEILHHLKLFIASFSIYVCV